MKGGWKWSERQLANHHNREYYDLDKYAYIAFGGCHNRVKDGKVSSIYWTRDRQGYIDFCKEMGPKPDCAVKWSVGRIDHNRGYEPGNVRWEDHRHNSVKRRGTCHEGSVALEVEFKQVKFRKGSPEYFDHQRYASNQRWAKQREKAS